VNEAAQDIVIASSVLLLCALQDDTYAIDVPSASDQFVS
jgi:hypothetical protein